MNDKKPILVTGAHRSGTTWVGKMLAAGGDVAYISEPLNVLHRPGVLRVPISRWYTYICEENESEFLPALQETLSFHYHLLDELRSLRSVKDIVRMGRDASAFWRGRLLGQRPLLKDPFAIFSAPWFAERLGCRVVITVRHPAAFISSLKKLGWDFDFRDLLKQPLLMRDHLSAFRNEMEDAQDADIIAQGALLWRMIYTVVDKFRRDARAPNVIRHEDISLETEASFGSLYETLGLAFNARARKTIQMASRASNPDDLSRTHSVKLDSRANIQSWKRRLTEAEIDRIRALTADVYPLYYDDNDWN